MYLFNLFSVLYQIHKIYVNTLTFYVKFEAYVEFSIFGIKGYSYNSPFLALNINGHTIRF